MFLEEDKKENLNIDNSKLEDKNIDAESKVKNAVETKSIKTKDKDAGGNSEAIPIDKNTTTNSSSKPKNNQRFRNANNPRNKRKSEFDEQIVDVARVTNVVKGGRRFSFSALVVIGNKNGKVGYGHGKANEVPNAIKKAIKNAQSNLITVPIVQKRTIPHISHAKYLSSNVLLKPAPKGKGIIASGTVRSVVELAGYKDIYTKSLGSRTKSNTVKATIDALKKMRTLEEIASLRDKTKSEILGG